MSMQDLAAQQQNAFANMGLAGLSGQQANAERPRAASLFDYMQRIVDERLLQGKEVNAEEVRRFSTLGGGKIEACGFLWRKRRLSRLAREAMALMESERAGQNESER